MTLTAPDPIGTHALSDRGWVGGVVLALIGLVSVGLLVYAGLRLPTAFALDRHTENLRDMRFGGARVPASDKILAERALEPVGQYRSDLEIERLLYKRGRLLRAASRAPEQVNAALAEVETDLRAVLQRHPVSGRAWFVLAQMAAARQDRAALMEALRHSYGTGPVDRPIVGARLEFVLDLDESITEAFQRQMAQDARTLLSIPKHRLRDREKRRLDRLGLNPRGAELLAAARQELAL